MMNCTVVIGTYNEAESIPSLLKNILELGPQYDAVVVDDNSPDGTGRIVSQMAANDPRVHLVERPAKLGYGTAYLKGFRTALDLGADCVVQMDADYSHNPRDIPRLVEAAEEADLVIGSRYIRGGSTSGWPLRRRLISRIASFVARLLLGLPIHDCTGGFKCFRRSALESIDFAAIRSSGFATSYEMNYFCHRSGKTVREIPITFINRQAGTSKLSMKIILEALVAIVRLRLGGARGRGRSADSSRRSSK
jgi:dolichol-phosphate mannosyltransferase